MVFDTLVGVSVFSVMWSELLITTALSCPLWSSVYGYQRVECTFACPVRSECGLFVMCCMQCCMSVSTGLYCVDVLSRGGIYMFAIVMCLVLLLCTLTILSDMVCVYMVECMSVVVIVMLSQMSMMSPPPALCNLAVVELFTFCFRGELGFPGLW